MVVRQVSDTVARKLKKGAVSESGKKKKNATKNLHRIQPQCPFALY